MKTNKKNTSKKSNSSSKLTKKASATLRTLNHRVADDDILHKSAKKNPVSFCWEKFSALKAKLGKDLRRVDAITACCNAGVAYYTARTQYQLWHAAGKAS